MWCCHGIFFGHNFLDKQDDALKLTLPTYCGRVTLDIKPVGGLSRCRIMEGTTFTTERVIKMSQACVL